MQAEILTIGDEILIGQVIDSNSAWIAERLNEEGIDVGRITSVSDTSEAIKQGLDEAFSRVNLVLMTGGLGPTKDDITKHALCEYFDTKLVFNQEAFDRVEALFKSRGIPMPEVNKNQALVPESCTPIPNPIGTAMGMWFEKNDKVGISMPGVPFEMKGMMDRVILGKIREYFDTPAIYHKTVLTQGVGESTIMEKIESWENSLSAANIKLAYLPSPGMVRLRLSATGEESQIRQKVDNKVEELLEIIPQYIFGFGKDKLESVIGKLLADRNETMATAESCTGGYIAHLITSISGSSTYFNGSIVAYSNQVKRSLLGVSQESLLKHGAVSQQVVEEMALGARKELKTDYAIATSGIAGPDGGTEEKPVGTIWIAVASPNGVKSKLLKMGRSRERNIRMTALSAMNYLRKEIILRGDWKTEN